MVKEEIGITGMSCNHCVMAVKKEIQKLEGVASLDVQIGKAVVAYDESKTSRMNINDAIRNAGYRPA